MSKTYNEKVKARAAVARAKKNGALKQQPCHVCGDPNSEAHHPDYSRPLEVEWVCSKHHPRNVITDKMLATAERIFGGIDMELFKSISAAHKRGADVLGAIKGVIEKHRPKAASG